MCPMANVRVEPMEHNNQSFWLFFGRVAKGSKLDKFSILIEHLKFNEVFDGEDMISLGIR